MCIHSSVDGHLSCFQLGITINAAMNTLACLLAHMCKFLQLGVELPDIECVDVQVYQVILSNAILLVKVIVPIYIPTSS